MRLLEFVVKEYLLIVESFAENEPVTESNRIIVERELFKKILEKYAYITFKEKTKIYKALNLIIHDSNNYTMPYKDVDAKKTVRKVIINYNAYLTLKRLYETEI